MSVLLGGCFALGSDERVGKGTLHQWDLTFNEFKDYLKVGLRFHDHLAAILTHGCSGSLDVNYSIR